MCFTRITVLILLSLFAFEFYAQDQILFLHKNSNREVPVYIGEQIKLKLPHQKRQFVIIKEIKGDSLNVAFATHSRKEFRLIRLEYAYLNLDTSCSHKESEIALNNQIYNLDSTIAFKNVSKLIVWNHERTIARRLMPVYWLIGTPVVWALTNFTAGFLTMELGGITVCVESIIGEFKTINPKKYSIKKAAHPNGSGS